MSVHFSTSIKSKLPVKAVIACAAFAALGFGKVQAAPEANALPTGGRVASGSATISSTGAAPVTTINQSSQRAVIDWNKFDVGQNATVKFNQPNAQASTLNRVSDSNPSQIFGKIQSQGEVVLVNQAGVYFSPTASVDVGSIVATTHNISNDDYMAGKSSYDRNGSSGKVVNEGKIQSSINGYIALLAPEVRNSGVIIAKMGSVVLASGERITLNFDANKRISTITTTPSQIAALVENKMVVKAPGGLIILSAQAMNQLAGGVIQQSGKISTSASEKTTAGLSNQGGRIILDGGNVTVATTSKTVANGTNGGGSIEIKASNNIIAEAGSKIAANAKVAGNGGKVIIMSDKKTVVDGTITAQGGTQSGNGGLIETSSKEVLQLGNNLTVNAGSRSSSGKSGTWLLDPFDLIINSSAAQIISNVLNSSNVRVEVNNLGCAGFGACASNGSGNLTLASGAIIEKTSGNKTSLTLVATGNIDIFGNILSQAGAPLDVFMEAGSQIYLDTNAQVQANKIEAKAQAIQVKGSLFSYGADINSSSPLIALLAGRINITGLLRANARNTPNSVAGKITIEGQDEVLIADATIEANGGDGGEIKIISLNGSVNITESYIQTNGGQGRGGAISVAGLQETTINAATLEATGQEQGGTILIGNDAENGTLPFSVYTSIDAQSIITASQLNSTNSKGGFVETSGQTISLLASINAGRGGMWLIDPTDILIDITLASTIGSTSSDVTITTGGSSATVVSSGNGNIYVNSAINKSTGALTFSPSTADGGATYISANITTGGAQTYNGNVYINGSITLTTSNSDVIVTGSVLSGYYQILQIGTSLGGGAVSINGAPFTTSVSGLSYSAGTYTYAPSGSYSANYLLVGGGGGGGSNWGGGGGAGGFLTGSTTLNSSHSIVIGVGGAGASAGNGSNGGNSTAFGVTAYGGGGGGAGGSAGLSGASGGGAGGISANNGGSATQGYAGGTSVANTGGSGGGGSGGAGSPGSTPSAGGNGGPGTVSEISGSSVTYAAGGGGAAGDTGTFAGGNTGVNGVPGAGGSSGAGGIGGTCNYGCNAPGANGVTPGSGGGGGSTNGGAGGDGASGIVILSGTVRASGSLTIASGSGKVDLSGTSVNLSSLEVKSDSTASSISAQIVGSTALTMTARASNNATLSLTGNNSYTGLTRINLGVISISSAANINGGFGGLKLAGGRLQTTGDITLNPTLTLEPGTSSMFIASTGTLTINSSIGVTTGALTIGAGGSGTVVLGSENFYTGGTIVYGKLTLGNAGALSTGGVTLGSGTLNIAGFEINNPITLLSSGGTIRSNAAGGVITGGITLNANSMTLSAASGASLEIGTTAISGTGTTALTIGSSADTGSITFSAANTYVGSTNVLKGTLNIANAAGLGTSDAGTTIASGATLDLQNVAVLTEALTINGGTLVTSTGTSSLSGAISLGATGSTFSVAGTQLTLSGVISGGNGFTKTGSGTLTLSNANTYTGATTISAGTLKVGNAAALGPSTGAGAVSITSGAVLDLNGQSLTNSGTLTIRGTGISSGGALINSSTTAASYSGLVALGAASSIVGGSGTIALTNVGTITGATFGLTLGGAQGGSIASIIGTTSGTVTKEGTGTWTLSGLNTYTGLTSINGGVLSVSKLANGGVASGIGQSSNVAANLVINGGTLKFVGATAQSTDRLFTIGANGGTLDASGTGTLTWSGNGTGSANAIARTNSTSPTLTLSGTGIASIASIWANALMSGTSALTKTGTGTWQISASNTYTGATSINNGTLQLGNASAFSSSTAITINTNGALDLNGLTVSKSITLNGGALTNSNTTTTAMIGNAITITLTADSTLMAATGATLQLGSGGSAAPISGAFAIRIGNSSNRGDVKFQNSTNTYTGGTIIDYGRLLLRTYFAAPSTNFVGPGAVTVNANGTFDNFDYSVPNAINLNGGILSGSSPNGNGSFTGVVTLTADSTIAGYTMQLGTSLSSVYLQISGGIVGNFGLTIGTSDHQGRVYFFAPTAPNAYSYSGSTIVAYGALALYDVTALNSSSLVRVETNGALILPSSNTFSKALTLNGGVLIDAAANTTTLSSAITLMADSRIAVVSGATLSLNTTSTISGDYGLTYGIASTTAYVGGTTATNYNGTITVGGNNSYKGLTNIAFGKVSLGATGSGANSPLGTVDGGTVVNTGAVLDLNGKNLATAELLTISGTGISNSGALMNSSATTATYSGLLTLGATSSVIGGSGAIALTNPGVITGSGFELKLGGIASASSSISSIIGLGNGAVTKQDSGTWTLTGANTYTGITTVAGGILSVTLLDIGGNASSLGASSANASNLVFSGGSFQYSGSTAASTDRLFTVTASGATALTISTSSTGSLSFTNSGSIVNSALLANRLTLSANTTNTITFNPVWGNPTTGVAALYTAGSGTVVLGGLNTYTGITSAGSGTLSVSVLADGGAPSNIGQSSNAAANLIIAGTFKYTGATATTDRLFTISGNIILNAGSGALIFSNTNSLVNSYGAAAAITLSGTGTATLNSVLPNNGSNVLSLTKSGSGTWTLSGANTYTGSNTISAGTLQFGTNSYFYCGGTQVCDASNRTISSGPVGTGSVTIGEGATLDLNGNGASATYGRFYNSITMGPSTGSLVTLMNSNATTSAGSYGAIGLSKLTRNWNNNYLFLQAAGSANLIIGGVVADVGSNTVRSGIQVGNSAYAGTVVMSGINTFTSAGSSNYTIIDTGTLQISADANLGATPSSATSNISLINGGALLFSGQTAAFSLNSNRLISLGTGGGKIANNSSNYAVTIAGLTSGSVLTIGLTGNTGTVILSGSAATGYGGVTTVISGATLNLKFDGTPTFNSSAYTGAGTVILEPVTAGGSIALGGSGSTLNLPVSLSNKFTDPLTTLIIGGVAIDGSPNSGNITITGTNSFVNAISVVSGGNITINSSASLASSKSSGNLVVAATGNFLNLAGASALQTTDSGSSDRWIVYTANPTNANFGTSGTLVSGNKAFWGSTYSSLVPSSVAAGNRYVFNTAGTVTITTTNASMTYGVPININSNYTVSNASMNAAPTGNPYVANSQSDLFATAPTIDSTGNNATAAVGQYDITASGAVGATGFSTFTYTNTGKLTVAPATITLGVVGSKIYDGSALFNASSVTVSGLANGDTLGTVTANSANVADNGSNYFTSFTLVSGTASNYVLVSGYNATTNAATINAKTVSLSASKVYNGNTSLTGGVTIATGVGSQTLTYSGATASDANVATLNKYISAIILADATDSSGGLASNYQLPSLTAASAGVNTVTITPKTVSLSATKTYDGSNSLTGAVTITTGVGAETLSYTGATASNVNVVTANKFINAIVLANATDSSGGLASNYQLPSLTAASAGVNTVTIDTQTLTIAANNDSKTYGTAKTYGAGSTAFTSTGLQNSETIGSVTVTDTNSGGLATANAGGTYALTPSAATGGTFTASNYNIGYTAGALTVNKATLTVTADAKSMTYGGSSLPTLTATITGFVNSQNLGNSGVNGSAALSTTATAYDGSTAGSASVAGSYTITPTLGTLTASNYDFSYTNGSLTVNRANLTVTAANDSKIYGATTTAANIAYSGGVAANVATGYSTSGLVNGDTISSVTLSSTGANNTATVAGGPYTITPSALSGSTSVSAANYNITYTNASTGLTVNKATLTYVATPTTSVYGSTPSVNTGTVTGFVDNETASVLTGTLLFSTTATGTSNVGSYAINGSGLSSGNYQFVQDAGNSSALTIGQKSLTVTANAQSTTYGSALTLGTSAFATSGLVNSDTVTSVTLLQGGNSVIPSTQTAGTYNNGIIASGATGNGLSNYSIAYSSGTLTINKATLTVTADNKTRVYGDSNPSFTYIISGYQNSEDATSAGLTGTPSISSTATAASGVNTYTITSAANDLAATNYQFIYANGTLTVNRRPVTVTGDNKVRIYGAANPTLTYTIAADGSGSSRGLYSTDSLTGNLATAATASTDVGTPAITQGTLTNTNNGNYDITCNNGTLTINKATLTVTADNQTRVYGDANSTLSYAITGYVNSQNLGSSGVTGTPTISTTATQSSNVGTYTITSAANNLSASNYDFSYVGGTLTVNRRPVTVTADAKTKIYGDTNPTLTYTVATDGTGSSRGLYSTDTLSGSLATTAINSTGVGAVAITQGTVDNANNSNYDITYTTGNLTIGKATLTVTADNQARVYGDANPTLTYVIAGYKNSENATLAGLTGTPTISTTATQSSNVGTYTITSAANNLSASNYDFSYVGGTLTVNRRPVTVTADAKTKIYGDANPILTYSIAANGIGSSRGMYNGETLTGNLATTATQATGVGTPAISQGTLNNANNANYDITYNVATLTINPAQLTVTANNDAKFVTQTDVTNFNGVNYSGFVNGDTASNLSGTLSITRTNASQNNAGVYSGVLQPSGLSSANYTITYAAGNYTITPAQTLLVDVNNLNITYGNTPIFVIDSVKYLDGQNVIHTLTQDSHTGNTYTYSDGVGGSATFTLTTNATLSSSNNLVVGNYSLIGANFTKVSNNFNNSPVYTGNLAVEQKALTAGTSSVSKVYDGSASMANLNISLNPIIAGDVVTSSGQGAFSQAGVGQNLSYSVSNLVLSGADSTNYYLFGGTSFSGNNGEITKAPLGINVTAAYNGTTTVIPSSVTVTGLVNNETLTVTSVGLNAANVAANSTNYVTSIAASSGTASLANYEINSARNATLATSITNKVTLNPVAITVTANNQSRVYGAVNPSAGAVTLTSGTLYGGDTLSNATVASAALSTTAAGQVVELVPSNQTFTVANAEQNYTITYVNGSLTIDKAPLGVAVTGTYSGTTTITPTNYAVTGLANNETLTPTSVVVNNKNVAANGSNYVTSMTPSVGDTASLSNYELSLVYNNASATTTTNIATINKANLTISATPSLSGNVYNGNAYTGGYSTTALNGETFTITGMATGVNAGTYTSNLAVTGSALANYNTPTINNANLMISPKSVTITNIASATTYDGSTTYAGLMSAAGFGYSALVGSDTISAVTQTASVNASTVTGVAQAGSFVSTPSVAVMGVGLASNYAFTYVVATNTIAKANLTVTASNDIKTYNGLAYTGGNGVTYVGLVNNETSSVLSGAVAYSGTSQNAVNVGSYVITPSGLSSNNYNISFGSGSLTVNRADLTVTASNATKTYNGLVYTGGNGVTYVGLVNNETSSVLSGTVAYSGTSQNAVNVGSYVITPSGLSSNNYNITFANGSLTVNKATLTVTADNQSRVYGDANPTFTQTLSGFVNGQTLATSGVIGTAYGSTTAVATNNVGAYSITASASGLSSANYQFTTVNGTLNVTARPITVVAAEKTKVYGSLNPTLTYSVVADGLGTSRGLYGSDTLSGALSVNASISTPVGNVAIDQHTLSNTNYNITYVGANLVITPATLSVTGHKTYDGAIAISGTDLTVTGVNGEHFFASGSANLVSKNVQVNQNLADVNGLVLAPSGSALISNYLPLDVTNTQFTVYAKAVTLIAPSITKTYDGGYAYTMTNTDLANMSSQLVGGDTVSAASVSYATNGAGINKRVDLNSVTINDGNGGANYSVTRSYSTTSVINKADLIVKAANDAKFVTTQDVPNYSGVFGDGFVNGEGLADLSGTLAIARTNASVNSAGQYAGVLVPSGYTSANYNITYQNGDYTILPAETLLIRVSPSSVTYGDVTSASAPAYTYTAQYLPAATQQNPSPTPVSLTATSPVNGVYYLDDQVGGTATFKIGVVNPDYSSTGRLAVGGYDMVEKNVVVTGNNFGSMLTVGALTVLPKVISATNLGISGVAKVYDGNASISGTLLNVNAANSQLLTGDVVNVYANGSYANADVGVNKSIIVDVVLSTPTGLINDVNNYSLSSTRVTGNLGTVTQLAQVTWTGAGANRSWSNASNWAGGATPTFSVGANVPNVAHVIIPHGATVDFDSATVGNTGSAISNNGVMNFIGSNNFTSLDVISGSGSITYAGSGVLTIAGNNTFTGGVDITNKSIIVGSTNALGAGSVTSSGGTLGVSSGVILPWLTVNGPVTLSSHITTSGAQIYNGVLTLGQSLILNAGSSSVTFNANVGHVGISYADYVAQHGSNNVYDLTVLADTVNINADITTYGTQTYGSDNAPTKVVIGGVGSPCLQGSGGNCRILISEDPAITVRGTINDSVVNTHDLILKSVAYSTNEVPTVELKGNVGDLKSLKSLTVSTGAQETTGSPLFADISQAQYRGSITLLGDVTTLNNQEYTADQITVGSNLASDYTFTSTDGRVIFNTSAGTNVSPTVTTGSSYTIDDTYTANLRNQMLSSTGISSALVLSEIARFGLAANDVSIEQRKVGNGGGSMEIICVSYDDDGNCKLDE